MSMRYHAKHCEYYMQSISLFHQLASATTTWIEKEYFPNELGVRFTPIESIGAFLLQPLAWSAHTYLNSEKIEGRPSTVQKIIAVVACILTLPITLVALGCKGIGVAIRPQKLVRNDEVLRRSSPELIDAVYTMLKEFSSLAQEFNIDYRMLGGTALGAIRHGGMIPWDDDGDLFMQRESFDRLVQLKDILQQRGIQLEETKELCAMQLSFSEEGKKKFHLQHRGTIDIFLMKPEEKSRRVIFASSYFQSQFPNEWCTEEEWQSTSDWSFGSKSKKFSLKGFSPEKEAEYLKRAFGQDCLETAVHTHSHFDFFGLTIPFPVLVRERVIVLNKTPACGNQWN